MPEAADPFNADMQRRARKKAELEAAEAKRREIEKAYSDTGQLPLQPGMVAGTWGQIASKDKETEDLAAFSRKRKPKKDQSRVPSGWDQTRQKVASAIDKPVQKLGKIVDYYAGPHASEALGRAGQAGDIAASMTPVLGDIRDMTTLGVEAVDDLMAGEYGSAAMNVGLAGSTLLPAIFIGPKAKNFPHNRAADAMDMLRQGVDPETIRTQTGIVFDAEGIPRFEISDANAKLTPKGERFAKGGAIDSRSPMMPFGVAYDHPELFDNYPQLMDYPTRFADDGGPAGAFYPAYGGKNPQVEAYGLVEGPAAPNYKAPKNLQQVILHEGQHAVDDIENASMGSMPANVPREVMDAFPGVTDYQLYRRAGGETLANTTAARAYLDDDMRGAISPYHSGSGPLSGYQEQFPRSEQWSETMHPGSSWDDPRGTRTVARPAFDPANPNAPRPDYLWGGPSGGYGGASREPVMGSVEEAATPAPRNGPRRRGAISGLSRGMGDNGGPTFTDEELLAQAVGTPRKQLQGNYIGAPPGIGSPEAEQALIDDLLERIRTYEGGGEGFYTDAQDTVRQWTDDPVMARRFASASGHTSNQMSPLPNTTHALKAMNQYAAGQPVKAGLYPNASGAKAAESMATDTLSPDPKTGQYSYHLVPPEYRPENFGDYAFGGERAVSPGRAVHDTWDKEAFRYAPGAGGKQNAASDTQHLFMDRVYNKVVREVRRDPALRQKYGTGPMTYETVQAALWDIERRQQGKFDVLPFADIFDQNTSFTQMAAIPGPSTGVGPELLNAPMSTKRQYTDDMFRAISTPDGASAIHRAYGMSPAMQEGFGPWQGMMEPNRRIDYAIGSTGSGKSKAIDPASDVVERAARNQTQLFLGQEGAARTAPRSDGATANAADLATIRGVPLKSESDYQRAFNAVEQVFGPGWADSVVVQPTRDGLMIKSLGGGGKEFHGAAAEVHRLLGGTGAGMQRDVANDFSFVQFNEPSASRYAPDVWKRAYQPGLDQRGEIFPNEGSYHRLLDETRTNPAIRATFEEKVQPRAGVVQQTSEDWAKQLGTTADTIPDRVRRILSTAGRNWPQALDEAVRKGVIPAFVAGAVYQQMGGDQLAGEER
jgi:hypothetical protein